MNLELLKRLSEARGISGDEGAVRSILADALRASADRLACDAMGNLYADRDRSPDTGSADALIGADGRPFRVMLAAHMDEVGLMVTRVDSDGTLAFESVGGIDARVLAGQAVRVGREAVPGVIGLKPVHLSNASERGDAPTISGLRIDLGVDHKDAAEALAQPGDAVTFATEMQDLGPTLLGKAFDDRGGCAMLTEVLDEAQAYELKGIFTVQEEVGLRGATVAAHRLAPHAAIVLECGTTDDGPKDRDDTSVMRLGHGPAITVMDRTMVADARLSRHLMDTARAEGIPFQIRAPKGGGTDGGRIHLAREGVPTAVISIPCRYLHAPASMIAKSDYRHALALLRAALRGLKPEVLQG